MSFTLQPRLAADSMFIARLGLCEARLINDRRFPWVILVPMSANISELHQLSSAEQQQLLAESGRVANCLIQMEQIHKINVGALGNLVPQFHWHVIGRHANDPCWPGPVWGCGQALPYNDQASSDRVDYLREKLQA